MSDGGNLLNSFGVDPQLVTSGAAGGLVKALIGRQRVLDAIASMVIGAILANYAAKPAVALLARVEVFGNGISLAPEFGGMFVGVFSYAIVQWVGDKFRKSVVNGNGGPK